MKGSVMHLKQRFQRLSFWNKLAALAAFVGILGFCLYLADKVYNQVTSLPEIHVSPTQLTLHAGSYEVKTPLSVTNTTRLPLYNIELKLELEPPSLKSESVQIARVGREPKLEGRTGPLKVDQDLFMIDITDSKEREALVLVIASIDPQSTLTLVVYGTTPVPSQAKVVLWCFDHERSPLLAREGGAGIGSNYVPEAIILRRMRFNVRWIDDPW